MRNSKKGRFRVWDRSQDSFNGEDLVYNFDNLDELIGGPDGATGASGNEFAGVASSWLGYGDAIPSQATDTQYPGTTNAGYEVQSGRRTLYSIVSGLNYNDVPLGAVVTWWRPSSSISIPDGWVPCDGRTLSADQHSYPFAGTITVPDLRNKFVIGADAAVPGINAFNGYALEAGATPAGDENNDRTNNGPVAGGAAYAPGIGYDAGIENPSARSGTNKLRSVSHSHTAGTLKIKDHTHAIDHTHSVPPHAHRIEPHSHEMTHHHLMPNHEHQLTATFFTGRSRVSSSDSSEPRVRVREGQTNRYEYPSNTDHVHRIDLSAAGGTGRRKSDTDANRGLFNLGGYASDLWGYPIDPLSMNSYRGYEFQAITSYPTHRRHNGGTLNAHDVKYDTGVYNPGFGSILLNTSNSGSGTDGSITTRTSNSVSSGNISSGEASFKLDTSEGGGNTSHENLSVNIRPQYVGLLYLIKVKVSTNVI